MKRLLSIIVILTLTIGAPLALSGCATVQPKPTVDAVTSSRDQGALLATATKNAFKYAREKRNDAQALYDAGKISSAVMQRINDAGNQADLKGQKFIDFVETVTTDADLRTTAEGLLNLFKEFIDSLKFSGVSGSDIHDALAAFFAYLGGE